MSVPNNARLTRAQRWELRSLARGPRFVGGGGEGIPRGTADALLRRGLLRPLSGSRVELTERGRAVLDEIAAPPAAPDPATPPSLRLIRGDR